jgi:hypothetical protein
LTNIANNPIGLIALNTASQSPILASNPVIEPTLQIDKDVVHFHRYRTKNKQTTCVFFYTVTQFMEVALSMYGRFVSFCLFVLLLVGCSNQAPDIQVQGPRPSVASPAAGKTTVVGQILGTGSQTPIKNTPVYLAQVYTDEASKQSAYALNLASSPATISDENGFFTFTDVDPNPYVIIVGDYYGENDVVKESNGDARVYQFTAGEVVDVAVVQVKSTVAAIK